MSDLESIRDRIAKLRLVRRDDVPRPACAVCSDTGWQPVTVDGVARMTRCHCWLQKQQRFADGVPREFQDATLETYRPLWGNERAIAAARDFLAAPEGDLFIGGQVGCGKTRLACSILNAFWREHLAGFFVRVAQALYELQPRGEDDPASAVEWKLSTAPLLVLDDLGAERDRASDFTRRTLIMVYEARCDKGLRTIWTSNYVEIIQIMTEGGPGYSSLTLPVYAFRKAYGGLDFGYSSAISLVLVAILAGLVLGYMRLMKKREAIL